MNTEKKFVQFPCQPCSQICRVDAMKKAQFAQIVDAKLFFGVGQ